MWSEHVPKLWRTAHSCLRWAPNILLSFAIKYPLKFLYCAVFSWCHFLWDICILFVTTRSSIVSRLPLPSSSAHTSAVSRPVEGQLPQSSVFSSRPPSLQQRLACFFAAFSPLLASSLSRFPFL